MRYGVNVRLGSGGAFQWSSNETERLIEVFNNLLIKRKSNNSGGRMKALKAMFIAALVGASAAVTAYAEKLTIATVNNLSLIHI